MSKLRAVTVISPHRDDAALSLGLTICRWTREGTRVRIVNCFTISSYAPFAAARGRGAITKLRAAEDEAFGSAVRADGLLSFADLRRLDAPLRRRCNSECVCKPRNALPAEPHELTRLARLLRRLDDDGIVLCPLGVGGHIDHDLTRRAAIVAFPPRRLAFYEDLPYAAEYPEQVRPLADTASAAIRLPLQPLRVSAPNDGIRKQSLLRAYGSQLTGWEIRAVLRYSRSGELVWVPRPWKGRSSNGI